MADQYIIAATKRNYDVLTETDINNYVFHSAYNTFKIIKSGLFEFVLPGSSGPTNYALAHLLDFIPLVSAFASDSGADQAFPPNTENITLSGAKAGIFGTGVKFLSVSADDTNMIFRFQNTGGDKTVKVRYFCLESI